VCRPEVVAFDDGDGDLGPVRVIKDPSSLTSVSGVGRQEASDLPAISAVSKFDCVAALADDPSIILIANGGCSMFELSRKLQMILPTGCDVPLLDVLDDGRESFSDNDRVGQQGGGERE
jgi:hypothetical protein